MAFRPRSLRPTNHQPEILGGSLDQFMPPTQSRAVVQVTVILLEQRPYPALFRERIFYVLGHAGFDVLGGHPDFDREVARTRRALKQFAIVDCFQLQIRFGRYDGVKKFTNSAESFLKPFQPHIVFTSGANLRPLRGGGLVGGTQSRTEP